MLGTICWCDMQLANITKTFMVWAQPYRWVEVTKISLYSNI